MKIKNIHIENYKTYRELDLNFEVNPGRPIILIGGANGCGKTTLFDAIYHALYGLEVKNSQQFIELFNAGVLNETGTNGKKIVLDITFTGNVLGVETPYRIKRAYMLQDSKVLESVELNMNGNRFVYGSGSTVQQRTANEAVVNKIIAANLPAELSNYFLFDAMKTSELVKEEQINKLIMKNINSVMGFNKYTMLQKASESVLDEKKAEKLQNENQRKEYSNLTKEKADEEVNLELLNDEYGETLTYANEHKTEYESLKEGKNADEVLKDKIKQIEDSIAELEQKEKNYRADADALSKEFETKVIFPKLVDTVKREVELILKEKDSIATAKQNILSDSQIEEITRKIVRIIENKYYEQGKIDVDKLIQDVKDSQNDEDQVDDKFSFLSATDTEVLRELVLRTYINPFNTLDDKRNSINLELADQPKREKQLEEYKRSLTGNDYSVIEAYEANNRKIDDLKKKIADKKNYIKELGKKIATYDYDMPQVPDPQFDMLAKLPAFFKNLSKKLLKAKKESIERMMKEQLNINLVIYAGYIGRVELSSEEDDDEISFKIFHKNGNEIYLSQLNAGAKQTVMQVLLKVLYELGDYDPPVMIDTVMGVLDKESRDVILEKYFPDLALQTILLSTDTEITTERDFKKIQAHVSKTYTLHRNQELQCTTVSEDYFGLKTFEDY